MQPLTLDLTQRIKELWHQAEGVVILAGAGMSVDSGLPDFRGEERTTNLIRINPHEFETSRSSDLGISAGGLEGIQALSQAVG